MKNVLPDLVVAVEAFCGASDESGFPGENEPPSNTLNAHPRPGTTARGNPLPGLQPSRLRVTVSTTHTNPSHLGTATRLGTAQRGNAPTSLFRLA